MNWLGRLAFFAVVALSTGCAGTDFVRPDAGSVTIGKTTHQEILQRFGPPYREGTALKNEKTVRTASYAYAEAGGKPYREGVTPARAQAFHFHDDVLIGHEFVSSWASDHTDFDDRKIGDIVKGKTTRDEVLRMFGRPSGSYVHPLIKAPTGEAVVYAYLESRRTGFASLGFHRKLLVVTFNASGVVDDVEFTTSSS